MTSQNNNLNPHKFRTEAEYGFDDLATNNIATLDERTAPDDKSDGSFSTDVDYGFDDPDIKFPRRKDLANEELLNNITDYGAPDLNLEEAHQVLQPGWERKVIHTLQGSTITILYNSQGDDIIGTITIENYPDRSAIKEELKTFKTIHPEGPQGRVVFDLSKKSTLNLSKEEKLQVIHQLESALNVGRTESPTESDFAFPRGRTFQDLLDSHIEELPGTPGLTESPKRNVYGLFSIDPDPHIEFKGPEQDANYLALKNYCKSITDQRSDNKWELQVERTYASADQKPLERARKIFAGERDLVIRIVGKGEFANKFGENGDHFYELVMNQWDNGRFLTVNAGKPKIDGEEINLLKVPFPSDRTRTPQQMSLEGDGRGRFFLYLGDLREPFGNIERTLYLLADKLAEDHNYTQGGKYLCKESRLAEELLSLCDGQRKRGADNYSQSAGLIGINDLVIHGCNWARFGLADFIKRCHIRKSNIGILGQNLNLWDNNVDDTRLVFRNSDGKKSSENVSIEGGYYGSNVEVYGGIKSGNLEADWHCNMMDIDEFGVDLFQRWGIIQKYLHLRGSRINPKLVTDDEWRSMLAPVWPYFENWYYRSARDEMLQGRELINIFTTCPTIGTAYRGHEDTPYGTWGQCIARGQMQGENGKYLFEMFVDRWEDDKKKRDRRAGFNIVQTNLGVEKGELHIRLDQRASAGKWWAETLAIIGSPHSLEATSTVVNQMKESLENTYSKNIREANQQVRDRERKST